MKKTLLPFCFLSVLSILVNAQISIGPKINFGGGAFHSSNFQKNLNAEKVANPYINQWDAKSKTGFNFGLGGFIQYSFNDNIALWGELTYNSFSSGYNLTYADNTITKNNKTDNISSTAKINTSFFSIPILFKYSFKGKTGPYALAGLRINFISKPKITSNETETTNDYSTGKDKVTVTNFSTSSTLDVSSSSSSNLVIGGGYALEAGSKSLFIDVRYNYPISKSSMYTSNGSYGSSSNTTLNNALFGIAGVANANSIAPQYPLNDFKMGFLELSIAYTLFNK
jgi:Outer membrane protein beta-barrel domain